MPDVTLLSNPPTSVTPSSAPWPTQRLYSSKNQAAAFTAGSAVAYLDPFGLKLHVATVNTASPTQLKLNVASVTGGTVTFDLTGDGSAEIPVAAIAA